MTFFTRDRGIVVLSVIFLLLLWKGLSLAVGSSHLLPGPEKVIADLGRLISSGAFLGSVAATLLRGSIGFLIAALLAVALGIPAGLNSDFNAFIRPVIVISRSTPIIAFILLALIWLPNTRVPIFIGILTMFPILCTAIIDGVRNVDSRLPAMARVYRVSTMPTLFHLYLPAIIPYFFSGLSSAIGFGWRAVIIGEVLGQPDFGIGTMMQNAHLFLLADRVIAWTLVAVVVGYIFEAAVRFFEQRIVKWQ